MRRKLIQENAKTAVVTGVSSGNGAAIAKKLSGEGYRLALVARGEDRLAPLAAQLQRNADDVFHLPADLADPKACSSVFTRARDGLGPVDVLVNNAGLGWYGFGEQMLWKTARQMIEVNIASLTRLTLNFLSDMKERGRGHIINIGSIAGSIPVHGVAMYSTSKTFVDGLATSLCRELTGTGVSVSVVRAGDVAAPFYDVASAGPLSPRIPVECLSGGSPLCGWMIPSRGAIWECPIRA